MIPNIIFMSYSVGQDSRHEGKATVLRDFNNVRAPNKQQKKKCDPLMSVCGFLWCLQQQEEAQTGPGSRCFYQPSFRKATQTLPEVSRESWAAPQQTEGEQTDRQCATWTSSADTSPRTLHLGLYSPPWRQPETHMLTSPLQQSKARSASHNHDKA